MQLKDANVGDRVRVWYNGSIIMEDNRGVNPNVPMEATVGLLDPPNVGLVWKPGEIAPISSWRLVGSSSSWAVAMLAQGYERGYWAEDDYECKLVAQTSNPVYSREDLLGYPDVGVSTPKTEAGTHSIPTPAPPEKPFDFDAYNYGIRKP